MDFLDKYFSHSEQYPNNITEHILPVGIFWEYISTTFLDGFINYVNIKSAWLISRYDKWDDEEDVRIISVREPPGSFNLEKHELTKRGRFNLLTEKGRTCHTDFTELGDDVIILAKSKERGKFFYVFWFDMDCSDSCIGRFEAKDLIEAEVVSEFDQGCKDLDMEYITPREENKQIPLHYFQGWISG